MALIFMGEEIKKYLGIDWGMVRIGLSFGDSENKTATPLGVVYDIEGIIRIVKSEEIDEIVLGNPLSIADHSLPLSKDFENFVSAFKEKVNLPINFIDERFSSLAADALDGNKKTKASRDAVAAMLILQQFFDEKN